MTGDGEGAYYSGVQRCGAIWVCPRCSPKIRDRRATELSEGTARWLANGGGAYAVTLTARHHLGTRLAPMLEALRAGNRALHQGRAWVRERTELGIAGYFTAVEITYGSDNGWHPHLHTIVYTNRPLEPLELAAMVMRLETKWLAEMGSRGYVPNRKHGVKVQTITNGREAAEYVAKTQEGKPIGLEYARADLKSGREGGLTPFEILEYFDATGEADALELWHEYETATKGHKAMTWSRGMRKLLLPDVEELTDEQIAEAEEDGEPVAAFDDDAWAAIVQVPGLACGVLEGAERDGYAGVVSALAPYGVQPRRPTRLRQDE